MTKPKQKPSVEPTTSRERKFFRDAIKQQFRTTGDIDEWEDELVLKLLDALVPPDAQEAPSLSRSWVHGDF